MSNFNFNKTILGGRLTADPELKKTPSGVSVTTFTVAVNRRFQPKEGEQQTDFIQIVAWRSTAEFVCRFFRKASSICIVGSIQTRTWTDQQGVKRYATEVVADEAYFVDSKADAVGQPTGQAVPPASQYVPDQYTAAPQFAAVSDDEELPF